MQRPALILLFAVLCLSACAGGGSPAGRLNAYLQAAAGAESDRGWQYLGETTREAGYDNDKARYIEDASEADWDAFQWSPATLRWEDDGFASVEIGLLSAPSTVPAFLITGRVLNGRCEGDDFDPVGLRAFVDTRPLGGEGLGGGGWTGSQMKCNSRFIGDAAYDDGAP